MPLRSSEAAELIGCTANYVRLLIRSGKLAAEQVQTAEGKRYRISRAEAERVRDLPRGRGRPRIRPRKLD